MYSLYARQEGFPAIKKSSAHGSKVFATLSAMHRPKISACIKAHHEANAQVYEVATPLGSED
jgi:hypothetical protein